MIQEVAGLAANAKAMVGSQRGGNTDLHVVFVRRLLLLAVTNCVQRKDMVKQLFVFSDMQFDQAAGTWKEVEGWETSHNAIVWAYAEAGYDVLEIVYWNLAGRLERKGVAPVSGFRPTMMVREPPRHPTNWQSQRDPDTMGVDVISFRNKERMSEKGKSEGLDRGRGKGANDRRCFQCGQQGHQKKNCPSRKGVGGTDDRYGRLSETEQSK